MGRENTQCCLHYRASMLALLLLLCAAVSLRRPLPLVCQRRLAWQSHAPHMLGREHFGEDVVFKTDGAAIARGALALWLKEVTAVTFDLETVVDYRFVEHGLLLESLSKCTRCLSRQNAQKVGINVKVRDDLREVAPFGRARVLVVLADEALPYQDDRARLENRAHLEQVSVLLDLVGGRCGGGLLASHDVAQRNGSRTAG